MKLAVNIIRCSWLRYVSTYNRPKRFYKRVSVNSVDSGGFAVHLDDRQLKTPRGAAFRVPTHSLALAVSHEWDVVEDEIDLSQMHLTSLCNTAIDNPERVTALTLSRHIAERLRSDTLLFYAADSSQLRDEQASVWAPHTHWFCRHYCVCLAPSFCVSDVFSGTDVADHSAVSSVARSLHTKHDTIALLGLRFAAEALHSVILALACAAGNLGALEATRLACLETEFQTRQWGRIEWSHDVHVQDTCARVSAGVLVATLSSDTQHSTLSRL